MHYKVRVALYFSVNSGRTFPFPGISVLWWQWDSITFGTLF